MYQAEAIAPSAGTRAPLAATEPQVKAINAIAGGALGWDEGQITHAARELFGVANVSDLSRRQASEFIDALKAQQSNEKAAGKSGGKRAPEPEPIDGEVSVDDLFPPE
jgi:hypothetical protein